MCGVKYSLDIASQSTIDDEGQELVKLNNHDIMIEGGFGIDFYLQYFKFSPQIKISHGIINILSKDKTVYTQTIKNDDLENIQGNKLVGLYAGIGLAVCQAIGIIIMKPILLNTDPITISYLRVLIAAIGMLLSFAFLPKMNLLTKMKDLKQTSIAILCGLMGMGVGMTLFIIALKNGNPGVVSALSSTMPIMIIPFLWIATKNYSGHLSVLGALITCIGAAIIFLS